MDPNHRLGPQATQSVNVNTAILSAVGDASGSKMATPSGQCQGLATTTKKPQDENLNKNKPVAVPRAGAGNVNTRGQSSLPQGTNEAENDFIDVRGRRQRRKHQHKHTGKAEVSGSNGVGNFEASNYKPPEQKKIWLFISKTTH